MKPLRLLVSSPLWPHPSHSTRAANIVLFELLSAFAETPDVHVGFLKIHQPGEPNVSEAEMEGKNILEKKGVIFLPEFFLSRTASRPKWKKVFLPNMEDFYAGANELEKNRLQKKVQEFSPDGIFVPWSEWVTALAADLPYPKYAYYGNPDPKSLLARACFDRRHSMMNGPAYAIKRFMAANLESFHLETMRRYQVIGDVAANDAEYYRQHGLSQAHYIQNVWFDRYPNWRELRKSREQKMPFKIIGSIGKLGGTANTHGLELLGRDLLPELRRTMKRPFEIHVYGAGDPHPAVASLLDQPEIKLRGFVEDIDGELLSSSVFLCMNNASDYKVGHTRYLHAWSLGSCVVAHEDTRLSMPEFRHRENALLGRNILEMAEWVAQAAKNPGLREEVGAGGYDTFKKFFVASRVVPQILTSLATFV